jgi:hypothetical protein
MDRSIFPLTTSVHTNNRAVNLTLKMLMWTRVRCLFLTILVQLMYLVYMSHAKDTPMCSGKVGVFQRYNAFHRDAPVNYFSRSLANQHSRRLAAFAFPCIWSGFMLRASPFRAHPADIRSVTKPNNSNRQISVRVQPMMRDDKGTERRRGRVIRSSL